MWQKIFLRLVDTLVQVPDCTLPMHSATQSVRLGYTGAAQAGASLRNEMFFFLLTTALKDSPKGPPTANRQLPSTANRHQPPTTNRHQPPATNRRQPPAATNRQLPTTANCLQPPTASHQPPPTTTNRHQPPVANCQPPTAANRQPPTATTMVEHMECPRALLKLPGSGRDFFFFALRTALRTRCHRCVLHLWAVWIHA